MTNYEGGHVESSNVAGNEETVVGFKKEEMMILEKLIAVPKQQRLEVISIVGMPGIGKTTLARKVYNDPLTAHSFHLRAWIYVAREYRKRDLLLGLLSCIIQQKESIYEMIDEKLADELRKRLKGKRYLVVMDDIWDIRAWSDLRISFPDDCNGSRIVFTSRLVNIGLQAKLDSPIRLRFLTADESWDLFQLKLFRRDTFRLELIEIGKEIASKCGGLPLAIVLVAGVLAKKGKNLEQWKQVLESLSPTIVGDQLCMNTLAVSYNDLPQHLKRCFLYFGAFPEDYEIPVQKLMWLWIAEGLVQENDGKRLEDEAEEYLLDLINRSLAIVSKRRSDGRIKACRIHDLLHEFCLKQTKEEYRLQVSGHPYFCISNSLSKLFSCIRGRPSILSACLQNTSLIPFVQTTHTLTCIAPRYNGSPLPMFLHSPCFELLNMLDLICIKFSRYPSEVEQLVHLRYLAFGLPVVRSVCCLPSSISKLCNLETLILRTTFSSVMLPESFWEMVRLRHLCLMGPRSYMIEKQHLESRYPIMLDNLQTVSWVDPLISSDFMTRTPNLRKLGFRGNMVSSGFLRFPAIQFLGQLQKLKLCNTFYHWKVDGLTKTGGVSFPPNLKWLTLEETYISWYEMSNLGKLLPNLEVLKLLSGACRGPNWITSDGEFPQLKFLKFDSVEIVQWEISSNHFPKLQHLVLVDCHGLEEIPPEIGDIPTLKLIEVHWCNPSIATSARKIEEWQKDMGNHYLQIIENCQIQRT